MILSARLCSISVGRRFRGGVLKRGSMPRRAGVERAERGFLPCPGIGLKSGKGRSPRVAGAEGIAERQVPLGIPGRTGGRAGRVRRGREPRG
jgi:hypothetical protein